jgi:hypothetical protein
MGWWNGFAQAVRATLSSASCSVRDESPDDD